MEDSSLNTGNRVEISHSPTEKNYYSFLRSYLVFRILVGAGEMGMVMTTFTLSVEIVGAKQQALVGNMNQLVFAVGQIVVNTN